MNLTTGYYTPTPSFKNITEHVAVMDADDGTLFALVGAVEDDPENRQETDEVAALFAAAPEMRNALYEIQKALESGELTFAKKRRSASDPYHPANIKLCAAIAKLEGRD